jgi:beta-galactosidase
MDWLTGSAFWPFKDFSTPVRPENPIPYVNQKGVVCRDLTPKEIYYVFQSYWTKKPMMHIYGHTWPIRWGKADEKKEILVYSNCSSVELFVNGESQGIKKRYSQDFPAAGLRWNCRLNPGENTVIAVSHDSKAESVSDTINFAYETRQWGKPSLISTKVSKYGDGIVLLEIQLTDSEGVPCLDSKDWIYFGLTGDGRLIDNQGTTTGSRKLQAYNGRAAIKIETRHGKSMASVSSSAPDVKTVFVPIDD